MAFGVNVLHEHCFVDVQVFNPYAPSYVNSISAAYKHYEGINYIRDNVPAYGQRKLEHISFTPVMMSGGLAPLLLSTNGFPRSWHLNGEMSTVYDGLAPYIAAFLATAISPGSAIPCIQRNLRTFAIANVHGKNNSWNNHVNTFAIDWVTEDTNNYVYFCFLAQRSTTSNFLYIDQEVQLFASILISTEIQFMKYSARQNGLNHACASNFPIHFLMGFLGVCFQISVPRDT